MISRRHFLKTSLAGGAMLWFLGKMRFLAPAGAAELDFTKLEDFDEFIANHLKNARSVPIEKNNLSALEKAHLIQFDVPRIVENGAVVPVSVKMDHPMEPNHYIKKLMLFDENSLIRPKYIASFTPLVGKLYLSTNIRLAQTTRLKAIAECNLHGSWLGVSPEMRVDIGGCGAAGTISKQLGREVLNVRLPHRIRRGEVAEVSCSMKHPMESGFFMDQGGKITRSSSEFYIRKLQISQGDTLVSTFDIGPGLSNNPTIRFAIKVENDTALKLEATNTDGQTFTKAIRLSVID